MNFKLSFAYNTGRSHFWNHLSTSSRHRGNNISTLCRQAPESKKHKLQDYERHLFEGGGLLKVSNQVHGGSADKVLEFVKVVGIGRPKPEFEEHYKSFLGNVLTTD